MLRFSMHKNTVAHGAMIFNGCAVSETGASAEAVPGAMVAAFVLAAFEARRFTRSPPFFTKPTDITEENIEAEGVALQERYRGLTIFRVGRCSGHGVKTN